MFTDAGLRHSGHSVVSITLGCYPSQVGRGNEEIVAVTQEARRRTLRERRANGANGLPLEWPKHVSLEDVLGHLGLIAGAMMLSPSILSKPIGSAAQAPSAST